VSHEYECPHCKAITIAVSNVLRCTMCQRTWNHPETAKGKRRPR